jgi:hypothetical protein
MKHSNEANIRRLFSIVRSLLALDGFILSDEEFQAMVADAITKEKRHPGQFDAGAEALAGEWRATQTRILPLARN